MNLPLAILKKDKTVINTFQFKELSYFSFFKYNYDLNIKKSTKLLFIDKHNDFINYLRLARLNKITKEQLEVFLNSLDKFSQEVYLSILENRFNYFEEIKNYYPKLPKFIKKDLQYPYNTIYLNTKKIVFYIKNDFDEFFINRKKTLIDFKLKSFIDFEGTFTGFIEDDKYFIIAKENSVLKGLKFFYNYKKKVKNISIPLQTFKQNDSILLEDYKYILNFRDGYYNFKRNLSNLC